MSAERERLWLEGLRCDDSKMLVICKEDVSVEELVALGRFLGVIG